MGVKQYGLGVKGGVKVGACGHWSLVHNVRSHGHFDVMALGGIG